MNDLTWIAFVGLVNSQTAVKPAEAVGSVVKHHCTASWLDVKRKGEVFTGTWSFSQDWLPSAALWLWCRLCQQDMEVGCTMVTLGYRPVRRTERRHTMSKSLLQLFPRQWRSAQRTRKTRNIFKQHNGLYFQLRICITVFPQVAGKRVWEEKGWQSESCCCDVCSLCVWKALIESSSINKPAFRAVIRSPPLWPLSQVFFFLSWIPTEQLHTISHPKHLYRSREKKRHV